MKNKFSKLTADSYICNFIVFQTDVFKLEAVDLGKIYKMRIRHDNSLLNPAWYLEYVEVIDGTTNEKFMFHCERWLAKNKDDCKIERSFYVKVSLRPALSGI